MYSKSYFPICQILTAISFDFFSKLDGNLWYVIIYLNCFALTVIAKDTYQWFETKLLDSVLSKFLTWFWLEIKLTQNVATLIWRVFRLSRYVLFTIFKTEMWKCASGATWKLSAPANSTALSRQRPTQAQNSWLVTFEIK